jgi:hypothetical protein
MTPSSQVYLWDVEKDIVTNYDLASECLPGTEYGLVKKKDSAGQMINHYRRYPSNVHWDPEDPRLMAMEVNLYQQKLDFVASATLDDRSHDHFLTSRGTGDGDSSITTTLVTSESSSISFEEAVRQLKQSR